MRGRLVDGEVDNHNHSNNGKVGVQHVSQAAFPFNLLLRKA